MNMWLLKTIAWLQHSDAYKVGLRQMNLKTERIGICKRPVRTYITSTTEASVTPTIKQAAAPLAILSTGSYERQCARRNRRHDKYLSGCMCCCMCALLNIFEKVRKQMRYHMPEIMPEQVREQVCEKAA